MQIENEREKGAFSSSLSLFHLIFHLGAGKKEIFLFFVGLVKRYTLESELQDNLGFKWLYSKD